jgi:two-component system response regulator RegX3
MEKYNCLIVDDEETLSKNTLEFFNIFDIKTFWVSDKESCFDFLSQNLVDLILLDINLGNSSGFDICKELRKTLDIPILFISARRSDDDILLALNIGGDDYIQKPYSLNVLLAKVKVVLKRYSKKDNKITFGNFTIDFDINKLYKSGKEIDLKSMEFKLLTYLIQNKNRLVYKEEIFNKVWKDSFTGDGTLNVHIRRLREKIENNPNKPELIKTVWGSGYIFKI